jgi:hypothetical protein
MGVENGVDRNLSVPLNDLNIIEDNLQAFWPAGKGQQKNTPYLKIRMRCFFYLTPGAKPSA